MKKICVIGGGPSGLVAIKHCIDNEFEVIAFEKQDELGGAWIYTDETGVEVHSSMYQNLITNIPKEVMQFPDFPNSLEDRSFVTSEKILKYLNLYADNFGLKKFIKFSHEVMRVRPLFDDTWEVLVKQCNKLETFNFDAVLICNGFSVPKMPKIPGQDIFKGKQMHSHDYRKAKVFEHEKVLLIGSGPSGIEMALEIGKFAKKVYWSDHSLRTYGRKINLTPAECVSKKPDVKEIGENSVTFEDGSSADITMIAYATGYDFKFPFLSVDCGVSVNEKHTSPLYKHIFNINRPTMAFINIPFFAVGFPLYDLQVRCVLKFWRGLKTLPSKTEMLDEVQKDENERHVLGLPRRKFHLLGPLRHNGYYKELAELADVTPISSVYGKIFDETVRLIFENFNTYRNYDFTIVDDENFTIKFQETK